MGEQVYLTKNKLGIPLSKWAAVYFNIRGFPSVVIQGSNKARMFGYSAEFRLNDFEMLIRHDLPNLLQAPKVRKLVEMHQESVVRFT